MKMKTPDEIKKGLDCLNKLKFPDEYCNCPYQTSPAPNLRECKSPEIITDALAYIQQLEAANASMQQDLDRLHEAVLKLHCRSEDIQTCQITACKKYGLKKWRSEMDIMNVERLKQIRDMQQAKLEEMQKAGEPKHRIENIKFAIKCTDRRIERAQAADYEEQIRNIQPLGGKVQC